MPPTLLPSHAHQYATQCIPRVTHGDDYQISNGWGFLNRSSQLADHELFLPAPPVPSSYDSTHSYLANQASSSAYSDAHATPWNDPRSVAVGLTDRIFAWNTQIQSNLHKTSVLFPPSSSSEIPPFTSMAIPLRSHPRSPSLVPGLGRPASITSPPLILPLAGPTSIQNTRYPGGIAQQDLPSPAPIPDMDTAQSGANQATGSKVKEKKHGCWMCHKSFDRPSTLRKHLLVHTGEKAHACNICGRRFGVLSNLNRHVRRCAQKPVNRGSSSGSVSDSHSPPPDGGSGAAASVPGAHPGPQPNIYTSAERSTVSDITTQPTSRKRVSRSPIQSDSSMTIENQNRPKRRRRAPSPSRWIPPSLANFNLSPYPKSLPTPLPPVTQGYVNGVWEERNSFDENVGPAPYHYDGWTGKLPGPGLVGKDVSNISAHGKVLVF